MGENTLFALRETNPPADIPISQMNANQVLDSLIDLDKTRAFCDARKARLLARFAELREPERAGTDLADGAPEEVAIELAMNPNTAAIQIAQARDLVTRLPATTAALETGEIDYMRAKAMKDLGDNLACVCFVEDQNVWGSESAHRPVTRALGSHGVVFVDEAAEDRAAANLGGVHCSLDLQR